MPDELWAALWFAAPFAGLAFLARAAFRGRFRLLRDATPGERQLVIGAGLVLGLAGVAHVLVPEFTHFDDVYTFALAPIGAAMYVPHILLGLILGVVTVRVRAWMRSRRIPGRRAVLIRPQGERSGGAPGPERSTARVCGPECGARR